jgi:hypothetical protein
LVCVNFLSLHHQNNCFENIYFSLFGRIQLDIQQKLFLYRQCTRAVIPNLGYTYRQGYEQGHLGVREKKKNNGGKRHTRQQLQLQHTNLR